MAMESPKLGLISTTKQVDSTNEIRIEIQPQDVGQSHEGIHTIQYQSPGGSSHFVKGLVVTNSTAENSSATQMHTAMVHGHGLVGNEEIFLPDRDITLAESLGEDSTGQILQMVRLTTDENGETIIFVEPQEPQEKMNSNNTNEQTQDVQVTSPTSIIHRFPQHSLLAPQNCSIVHDRSAKKIILQTVTDYDNKMLKNESSDLELSDDEDTVPCRRCVVCLQRKKFTEDIFDVDRNPYYHISVLFAHLNMQVEVTPADSGVCLECLNYLQRWHIFHSTIAERHDYARTTGTSAVTGPLNFHLLETQFYKHYTKLLEAKEIFNAATHAHYARRHLTDKDWDFFCEKLLLHWTEGEKLTELKSFITSRDKLSKFLCTICCILIPKGKLGYAEHMTKEHSQSPVLYPCDICGKIFPEKSSPDSLLVDFFEHWISHFHSNNGPGLSENDSTTPLNANSEGESFPEETQDYNNSKKGKKHAGISLPRRQRYQHIISQITNVLHNSCYQHLVRRDLDEDSLEYMAERLLSTKSNSSVKMKEIEDMTFSKEKLRSIFCDDCRKTIPGGKLAYHQHRKLVHKDTDDDPTIPCDICGNFYPEKDLTGLSENYFTHWISHFYFQKCSVCQEKCPNANLLKKHSLQHEKRIGYPCPQCDKVLSKKTTLEQHIKTHLSEEEKKKNGLTCHICGKIITAPTLKAHMYSVHSDERPWKCEVCGVRFKHKSDLNGHRNAVHLKIKNYTCNICGKSFGHQCGLRVHIMSHEDKRNHSCVTCGKRFLTMWHLKKHIVTHKEVKDIICNICSKGFKKIESLQEHMTLHTGEMPYECHICCRKVRVLSNLYKHFMVHKKNKTYYSKKDGLPDPLDAYIAEQQKKKSVNKIVQEAGGDKNKRANSPISSSSEYNTTEDSMTNDTNTENILELETELQVNRSNNKVVTYPGGRNGSITSKQNHIQDNDSKDSSSFRNRNEFLESEEHNSWPKLGPVVMMDIDQ